MKQSKKAYIFILPFLLMFALFTVIPTLTGVYLSFTDYNGFSLENIDFIGLENYANLFDSSSLYFSSFWNSILRTVAFVIVITPLVIILPLIIASTITSLTFGKKIIKGLFYLPVVLSISGVAVLGAWVFDYQYGLFNYILSLFGVDPIPWLSEPSYAFIAIVILTVWWTMGGNLIIYIAALQGVPTAMYEAADIESANRWTKFTKITLPFIKPQLNFTLILSALASFNIFGQVAILTEGGPGESTTTAALYIRDTAFGSTHAAGQASAMGILFGLMLVGLTFFQFRNVIKELS